jgi:sigma-E factor negative regulatory protein RseA
LNDNKQLIMTTHDSSGHEMLSALFDGQQGSESALAHLPIEGGHILYGDWNCYHLIGEVLRGSSAAAMVGADPAFLQRLSTRLNDEVVEPLATPAVMTDGPVAVSAVQAANDQQFHWKLVAGFASLGAVAVLAWALTESSVGTSLPQVAQNIIGATLVTASSEGPMIRDARLEELLSAHKQMGTTTLQVPSGFVRHAGFEAPLSSGR